MSCKSKKIKSALVVVLVFLVSEVVSTNAQTTVQSVFNLETAVLREAAIPADVIAVLKSDERVDQCFRQKGDGVDESKWFAASEIDLNGDGLDDLIIKAKDICLYGANQGPFWIFQKAADGYQKILTASGLQLHVLPQKSNSFKKIKISKAVRMKPASEIYRFRAGKYQPGGRGK